MESIRASHVPDSADIINSLTNSIDHFDKTNKHSTLISSLRSLRSSVEKCSKFIFSIRSFAYEYDFDESTPGNGYRSFIHIYDSAIRETAKICKQLIAAREKIFFRADYYAKYNVQGLKGQKFGCIAFQYIFTSQRGWLLE